MTKIIDSYWSTTQIILMYMHHRNLWIWCTITLLVLAYFWLFVENRRKAGHITSFEMIVFGQFRQTLDVALNNFIATILYQTAPICFD